MAARKQHRAGQKHCSACNQWKPLSEFHRNRRTWDGLLHHCKLCVNERQRAPARAHQRKLLSTAEGRAAKALYMRRWNARRNFDLTIEEYDAIIARGCAICGKQRGARALSLDHDHKNGKVRAALCHGCNTGLGAFADNPAWLRAAIKYIEDWQASHVG